MFENTELDFARIGSKAARTGLGVARTNCNLVIASTASTRALLG